MKLTNKMIHKIVTEARRRLSEADATSGAKAGAGSQDTSSQGGSSQSAKPQDDRMALQYAERIDQANEWKAFWGEAMPMFLELPPGIQTNNLLDALTDIFGKEGQTIFNIMKNHVKKPSEKSSTSDSDSGGIPGA